MRARHSFPGFRKLYLINLGFLLLVCFNQTCAQIQWQHTDGPPGSHSTWLYSNDDYIFAPEKDFLFRSADGIHWEKITQEVTINMFIYDANLFVTCYIDDEWKLKVSENNGDSWIVKDLMPEISYLNSVALTTQALFATQANDNKLWKSLDMGDSWMEIFSPLLHPNVLKVFGDHLYVHNGKQIWVSDANGENWSNISPPLEGVNDGIYEFTVHGQDIVVACEAIILHSDDHGMTWEEIQITSDNTANKIAVTSDAIYVNSLNLYKSTDWGANWEIISVFVNHPELIDLAGIGNTLIASTWNKGIIRLDKDTGKFVDSHEGFTKGALYDLAYADGEIWVAGGKGIYRYSPDNNTWSSKFDLPTPRYQYEYIDANENGWVVTHELAENYFYLSKDHGMNWSTIQPDLGIAIPLLKIRTVQLIGTTLYLIEDELFPHSATLHSSTNGGITWEEIKTGVFQHGITEYDSMLFLTSINSIYQSDDNGQSWSTLPNPENIVMLYPTRSYLLGLSLNGGLFTLEPNGSWVNVTGNLELNLEDPFLTVQNSYWDTYFFQYEDKVYAFWNYNLYVSKDGLNTWQLIQEDISGNAYLHLNDEIFYGYYGLYRTGIDKLTSSIKDISNEEIDHRHLLVYPNPAQETVTVESLFENSTPGLLQVFSISGECISTERSTAPNSPIRINVSSFPEGIYLFRLTSKAGVETGKCIVHRK